MYNVKEPVLWYGLKIKPGKSWTLKGKENDFCLPCCKNTYNLKTYRKKIFRTTWSMSSNEFFKMHRSRVYKMLWLSVKCSVAVCAEWDKDVWAEWEDTPGPSKVSKAEGRRCSPWGGRSILSAMCWVPLSGANFSSRKPCLCSIQGAGLGLQRKADPGHGCMHLAIRHTETKTSELGEGLNFPEYPRKNSPYLKLFERQFFWGKKYIYNILYFIKYNIYNILIQKATI